MEKYTKTIPVKQKTLNRINVMLGEPRLDSCLGHPHVVGRVLFNVQFENGVQFALNMFQSDGKYFVSPIILLPDGRIILDPTKATRDGLSAVQSFQLDVEGFEGEYLVVLQPTTNP